MNTPERKRGLLGRSVGFIGRSLDLLRKTLHLLLLLLLFVPLLIAFSAGETPLGQRTTLVLGLEGAIVEQYTGTPSDRLGASLSGDDIEEVQLRDIRAALQAAASDPRIVQVLLRTEGLRSAGVSTLREVGRAIEQFRRSGKPVHAYGYWYDQRGLYLAAHADQVWLHPSGGAMLEGLGRNRTYYRALLDKLGIDVSVFRIGEYKSAVEPYLRDGPSAEAQEMDLYWLGDLWRVMLEDLARLRKREPAQFVQMIEELPQRTAAQGGDLGKLALAEGLVDELLTPDVLIERLLAKGARDEDTVFRQVGVKDYARLMRPREVLPADHVGVVVAEGGIIDGRHPPGTVGGDSTAALIRQAREDKHVKALVLRVDSPGGSGFASEVIRRELELTRAAGKPVVVSMGDVAASGGYWISMSSDAIWADPATITGSIGIYVLFPSLARGLDKLGVHSGGSSTAWPATAFDIARPLDPRLGEVLDATMRHGYQDFITKVAASRKQTAEQIDAVGRGRVWSAAQAREHGLVDRLGSFDEALADARQRAGLPEDASVRYIEEELSGFDQFLSGMESNMLTRALGKAVAGRSGLQYDLLQLARERGAESDLKLLLQQAQRLPLSLYSYCFCELP